MVTRGIRRDHCESPCENGEKILLKMWRGLNLGAGNFLRVAAFFLAEQTKTAVAIPRVQMPGSNAIFNSPGVGAQRLRGLKEFSLRASIIPMVYDPTVFDRSGIQKELECDVCKTKKKVPSERGVKRKWRKKERSGDNLVSKGWKVENVFFRAALDRCRGAQRCLKALFAGGVVVVILFLQTWRASIFSICRRACVRLVGTFSAVDCWRWIPASMPLFAVRLCPGYRDRGGRGPMRGGET